MCRLAPRRPRVSVVLPVRKAVRRIRESLDSLYAQTFTDFEILAVHDGSSDGTADLLRAEQDPRLRVLTTGGHGIVAALNHGIAMATGDLIARQDANDSSRGPTA